MALLAYALDFCIFQLLMCAHAMHQMWILSVVRPIQSDSFICSFGFAQRMEHKIENISNDLWFAINLNKLILFVLSAGLADCAVHRSLDTNSRCAWFVKNRRVRFVSDTYTEKMLKRHTITFGAASRNELQLFIHLSLLHIFRFWLNGRQIDVSLF